ncbi:Os01g0295600 [Oryza sativa Japonica Group]|uniref:Os01g0295600 protein n=1 Tax=Oryza sativa subsp. japonica TaxID=39947 RepID=C7IX12_ORYSJ|nr:Os01g0295600 [Oryza sativa Japonica Group]|eukprot:NP_001172289.1 Os01g0295600 [Oryza sativa Japonica Group]
MATLSYALCFAIVAGAIAASLWAMLSSRKRPPSDGSSPPHAVDDAAAASIGSAGASAMWSSRWSGVRPAWLLLASRAAAAVALAGVLLWDALTYDLTIMVYYTEYVLGGAVVLTDVVFWALIVPFMYSSHFSLNAVSDSMLQ